MSNGPSYSYTVIGTLAVDGWAVTFGTAKRGLGGLPETVIDLSVVIVSEPVVNSRRPEQPWSPNPKSRNWHGWTILGSQTPRVLTTLKNLENMEISGNLLILENSENLYDTISWASSCVHNCQ